MGVCDSHQFHIVFESPERHLETPCVQQRVQWKSLTLRLQTRGLGIQGRNSPTGPQKCSRTSLIYTKPRYQPWHHLAPRSLRLMVALDDPLKGAPPAVCAVAADEPGVVSEARQQLRASSRAFRLDMQYIYAR